MKRQTFIAASGAMMVALGAFSQIEAKAGFSDEENWWKVQPPFEKTPEGFINYLNTLTFDEGTKKFEFFNPRSCGESAASLKDAKSGWYYCTFDYKENTALGTRTCIDGSVIYNYQLKNLYDYKGFGKNCTDWEKVSVKPTPEPEAASEKEPKSNNEWVSPTHIGISAVSLIVGACIGFFFGRKKD